MARLEKVRAGAKIEANDQVMSRVTYSLLDEIRRMLHSLFHFGGERFRRRVLRLVYRENSQYHHMTQKQFEESALSLVMAEEQKWNESADRELASLIARGYVKGGHYIRHADGKARTRWVSPPRPEKVTGAPSSR